jgi:hypothetical protein
MSKGCKIQSVRIYFGETSRDLKSKTTLSVQVDVDGFVAMTGGQLMAL